MQRLLDPDEVAAALVWLAGEGTGGITAAVLPVDGGLGPFRAAWIFLGRSACVRVRGAEPAGELAVDGVRGRQPDAVGEQGVEAACRFQPAARRDAWQNQADVKRPAPLGWIMANCLVRRMLR